MRRFAWIALLLLPAAAWAQTPPVAPQPVPSQHVAPQPMAQNGYSGTTQAPVPDVVPGVPAGPGSGILPTEIAPPDVGAMSGPPDSTPFSAAPSAMLPSDPSMSIDRDRQGTSQASPVPNLSK